jgi:hypothetical protein
MGNAQHSYAIEAQPGLFRDIDPDRLEFLGETAAALKMARCYGRAPCGERCRLAVPFGPLLQLH